MGCLDDWPVLLVPSPLSCLLQNRGHLSPEDSKFAARMAQPLAQQPDPCVPQDVVGQIKLCQGLVDPQHGREILASFGCEPTAVQPVQNKKWLKQHQDLLLENFIFIRNQHDAFRDQIFFFFFLRKSRPTLLLSLPQLFKFKIDTVELCIMPWNRHVLRAGFLLPCEMFYYNVLKNSRN